MYEVFKYVIRHNRQNSKTNIVYENCEWNLCDIFNFGTLVQILPILRVIILITYSIISIIPRGRSDDGQDRMFIGFQFSTSRHSI